MPGFHRAARAWLCTGAALLASTGTGARSASRPTLSQARAALDRLPDRDRLEVSPELMATGDFDAMASRAFGARLCDATASFQSQHGLAPSGVLTPKTVAGGSGDGGTYSRCISVPGGIAGFTLPWTVAAYPDGNRMAVVMANELHPQRMGGGTGAGDLFSTFPADERGAPDAPDATAAAEPARAEAQARIDAQALTAALQAQLQARSAEPARPAEPSEADRRIAREAAQLGSGGGFPTPEAVPVPAPPTPAERLARAGAAARRAIAEGSDFVKANRDSPRLFDHLQHIADLNGSLSGGDADRIEKGTAALAAGLRSDGAYAGFAAHRTVAGSLDDAVAALKLRRAFLVGAVAEDPTGPKAGDLLALVRQADAALADPDLDRASAAAAAADAGIAAAGLRERFAAAAAR